MAVKYTMQLHYVSAGITEKILCTPQSLELLKRIQQRFKHSDVVQKNVVAIILKSKFPLFHLLRHDLHSGVVVVGVGAVWMLVQILFHHT